MKLQEKAGGGQGWTSFTDDDDDAVQDPGPGEDGPAGSVWIGLSWLVNLVGNCSL